ncbi:hypothetical protein [uncultured Tenacibaculum sp.]|uniref:hypothetical protein n=1 Tax=uncultured Tenacibaculum sp. TaxID=174713 RepID=UPI0026397C47|nr:hypothetical protein [uncultured Tenacibaculum sp.]
MTRGIDTNSEPALFSELPNKCPFCHNSISPNPLYGFKKDSNYKLDIFFSCPKNSCEKTFVGEYEQGQHKNHYKFLNRVTKGTINKKSFNESITNLSPSFEKIYNQAFYAEQEELYEICGVGYRKAIEFLIKDYAKLKYSEQSEQIEKKFLGKCIGDYIDDTRIKAVAKRAVWLGNDETHYVRKWEGKDLTDLKKLIDLTIHWIEMEFLTDSFETEMPE